MPPESDHHTELTELRSRSRTKLDDASRSNNTRWPSPTTVIEERRNNNTESAGSASHHRTEKSASRESNANFLHRIRDALFPIHQHELPKFALLSVIDFFVIVVVTLTRDLKDTLVVTQCGAESIAFLKIYGVLPAACLQVMWYNKLASTLSQKSLFYATAAPFFLFFVLYAYIIHPNSHLLQPSAESSLHQMFGGGSDSSVVLTLLSNWTVALFFIVTELYSSVSVGILFWKLANDVVVDPSQAKRFYPLFSYMSSFGPIVSGQFAVHYASRAVSFDASLQRIGNAIGFSGVMIAIGHYLLHKVVEGEQHSRYSSSSSIASSSPAKSSQKKKKEKHKMSMTESIQFLLNSEYLRLISVLVVGYGVMYNFSEISWKSLVKKQNPDPLDYQRYMGNFSSIVGATTFIIIFLGSNVINKFGWRTGALTTPFAMSLVSVPFFFCLVFLDLNNVRTLNITVSISTALILCSRSFKYGVFDATTQMSYIPLDEESKVKGKAAIDVLGSRLGKSGASLVQQGLVLIFGDILSAAPAIMVIYYGVALTWLSSAYRLGDLYTARSKKSL